jgi:hypothetical protein
MTDTIYCLCCGHEKPATDYLPQNSICIICASRPSNQVALMSRETLQRELAISNHTKAGRKAARIQARLDRYATAGKRCSSCHHHKPAADYNACAPASDGLQPICRSCNQLRVTSVKQGGLALWRTVRDALRATAPAT